jgi:hypothetical protein
MKWHYKINYILVGMGMNWIGYDIGAAGKAERNTSVVTVHVY